MTPAQPTLPGTPAAGEEKREAFRAGLRRYGDPDWRDRCRVALRSRCQRRPEGEPAPVQEVLL